MVLLDFQTSAVIIFDILGWFSFQQFQPGARIAVWSQLTLKRFFPSGCGADVQDLLRGCLGGCDSCVPCSQYRATRWHWGCCWLAQSFLLCLKYKHQSERNVLVNLFWNSERKLSFSHVFSILLVLQYQLFIPVQTLFLFFFFKNKTKSSVFLEQKSHFHTFISIDFYETTHVHKQLQNVIEITAINLEIG